MAIHCRACDRLIIDTMTKDNPGSTWTRQHVEFEAYMHMREMHQENMGSIEPLGEIFLFDEAEKISDYFHQGEEPL